MITILNYYERNRMYLCKRDNEVLEVKIVDLNKTVFQLVQEYPELKSILVDLGFTPLQDEKMLNTVGRMMPLNKGAKQVGISNEESTTSLEQHGFEARE